MMKIIIIIIITIYSDREREMQGCSCQGSRHRHPDVCPASPKPPSTSGSSPLLPDRGCLEREWLESQALVMSTLLPSFAPSDTLHPGVTIRYVPRLPIPYQPYSYAYLITPYCLLVSDPPDQAVTSLTEKRRMRPSLCSVVMLL